MTMNKKIKRSPLFYVGDKYRLMDQLLNLFPSKINNFYEPFVGGGTVFLNVNANNYFLNDVEKNIISIHECLLSYAEEPNKFYDDTEKIIRKYKLSYSYKKDIVPEGLKKRYKKTYYAKFNKKGYENLRKCVNGDTIKKPLAFYILVIYGFNRMMRFNQDGKFNLPVGNVDFNKNVANALADYFSFTAGKKIRFTSKDFRKTFEKNKYLKDDFIYLDPPYLIAASEYNKLWNEKLEASLLNLLDEMDKKRVKFALSNVTHYNGNRNDLLIKWMGRYKVHDVNSNYINYHNNHNKNIREVLITNY